MLIPERSDVATYMVMRHMLAEMGCGVWAQVALSSGKVRFVPASTYDDVHIVVLGSWRFEIAALHWSSKESPHLLRVEAPTRCRSGRRTNGSSTGVLIVLKLAEKIYDVLRCLPWVLRELERTDCERSYTPFRIASCHGGYIGAG